MQKVNSDQPSTFKICDTYDTVVDGDYVSDVNNILNKKPILRVMVKQIFKDSNEYMKLLKDKGKNYLESNAVVYPDGL